MAKRTIAGSRVLITGASSGIGREIALELGRHGADVVLLARREDRLRDLAQLFDSFPGRAEIVAGELTIEYGHRYNVDRPPKVMLAFDSQNADKVRTDRIFTDPKSSLMFYGTCKKQTDDRH